MRNKIRQVAAMEVDLKKDIHYDLDIEAAVLGACLNESGAFGRVKHILQTEDFHSEVNRIIFDVINSLFTDGRHIDMLIIKNKIMSDGLNDKFPLPDNPGAYLMQLSRDVVSTAHLEEHALLLKQLHCKRELLCIQMEAGRGVGEEDPLDKAHDIQQRLNKIMSVNGIDDWKDMATVMLQLGKHMDKVKGLDIMGVRTGFHSLDLITSGFQETQLIIIGARPSVGKTAFVSGLAINVASAGVPLGIINLEMPAEQLGARLVSYYSDIDFWKFWRSKPGNHEEEMQMLQAMADVGNLPISISDKTNVTVSAIRTKAERQKKKFGIKLLIIDYLQLVEGEGKLTDSREREVAKMSRGLKLLAMDLKIPVVLLVQLNRDSEKTSEKKPRMANIRESGAIEQDADLVMLLHRDWKSGILQDKEGNSTERQATIIIEKHRNGECGELQIGFEPGTMKFYESATVPGPAVHTEKPF